MKTLFICRTCGKKDEKEVRHLFKMDGDARAILSCSCGVNMNVGISMKTYDMLMRKLEDEKKRM